MKLNRICFLDAATFGVDYDFNDLSKLASLTVYSHTDSQDTLERIRGFDIVITNKVVLNEAVLSKANELKLICVAATGTNNVDLQFAESRGIQVCNAVGYSTHSVAQHWLGRPGGSGGASEGPGHDLSESDNSALRDLAPRQHRPHRDRGVAYVITGVLAERRVVAVGFLHVLIILVS